MQKAAKMSFNEVQQVHMDFNIAEFVDVRVDQENKRLTLVVNAVTGDPFNVDFRTNMRNQFGSDAAERLMDEAAYVLMKGQVIEKLKRG